MKRTISITMYLLATFLLSGLMLISTPAAPGDLDPSFGSSGIVSFPQYGNGFHQAQALAIQPDGKIVVAGSGFDGTNGGFGVARYNPDGSPDLTFGSGGKVVTVFPNGNAFASGVKIQSDGKIVAGGGNLYYYYGDDPPNYDVLLARYNTDGSLDPTFGTGGKVITTLNNPNSGANDIAIQSDGKIVAVGSVSNGSGSDFLLVRYNTTGSLDTSFGTGGKVITSIGVIEDLAFAVAIQSDGRIIAAGYSYNGTTSNFALVRYNADGSLDSTFGAGGKAVTILGNGSNGFIRNIGIQWDGKIVAAGRSVKRNNDDTISGGFALVRYNLGGSLDSTFGTGGIVVTSFSTESWWAFWDAATAIQTDGKIVVAGHIGPLSAMFRFQGRAESSFTVTRSDDRNATCAPGDCSLREAVNAANASQADDTINFAAGLRNIALTNEIVINNAGALTISGPGANILTIDGGPGTNRIFTINGGAATISGVTLTGGNGTGAISSGDGGAIFAYHGLLTLDGVHVTGNSATAGGGVEYIGGTYRITNSAFAGNNAFYAGGIDSDGSLLTIVNSTISGNTAECCGAAL